jgi:hypothetical protein
MLVTDWPPNCGGPDSTAWHDEFAPLGVARTIGANWSAKIPGNSGRFPVRLCLARNQSPISPVRFRRDDRMTRDLLLVLWS